MLRSLLGVKPRTPETNPQKEAPQPQASGVTASGAVVTNADSGPQVKSAARMICGTDKPTPLLELKPKVVDADEGIDETLAKEYPEPTETTSLLPKKKKGHKKELNVMASLPSSVLAPKVKVATTFGSQPAPDINPGPMLSLQIPSANQTTQPMQTTLGSACSKSLRDKTQAILELMRNQFGSCTLAQNAKQIIAILDEATVTLIKNKHALAMYKDERFSGKSDAVRLDDVLDHIKRLYHRNDMGQTLVDVGPDYALLDAAVRKCSEAIFNVANS